MGQNGWTADTPRNGYRIKVFRVDSKIKRLLFRGHWDRWEITIIIRSTEVGAI